MIRERSLFNKIKGRKYPWMGDKDLKNVQGSIRKSFRRTVDNIEEIKCPIQY